MKEVEIYTYVGSGASSPEFIKFMDLQEFVKGQPTEVTNPIVLAKIANNQCFVKGEADKKVIAKAEAEAVKIENEKKAEDDKINKAVKKKMGAE